MPEKFVRLSVRKSTIAEGEGGKYHKAQVTPLVEEIPVYVDTVRLAQIFGDQGADGGQVLFLKRVLVLNISQFSRELCCFPFVPRFQFCHFRQNREA